MKKASKKSKGTARAEPTTEWGIGNVESHLDVFVECRLDVGEDDLDEELSHVEGLDPEQLGEGLRVGWWGVEEEAWDGERKALRRCGQVHLHSEGVVIFVVHFKHNKILFAFVT